MSTRPRGRPFDTSISEGLLRIVERNMVTGGYSALTVDGLVNEVGTTRPAFYRRYKNISYLVFEVLKSKFNSSEFVPSGSLHQDLLNLQQEEVAMFSSPMLRNTLAGLLETVRTNADLADLYDAKFIQPRRERVRQVIEGAVERGEIQPPSDDIDFLCDLLLGPFMSRLLLPNPREIDDELAEQTAGAVYRLLTSA